MTRTKSDARKAIEAIPPETDAAAKAIVEAAFAVHSALGPGLLESVYEACLAHEFHKPGLSFKKQLALPILYDGIKLEAGLRLDFVVEDCVVVEVKAVDTMIPVFQAQVLTYLKLTGHRLGLLINFNVPVIQAGIRRLAL